MARTSSFRAGARGCAARIVAALLVMAASCVTGSRASGQELEGSDRVTSYRTLAVRGSGSMAALRAQLGPEVFDEVLRLNRVDLDHVARLDSVVVPEPAAGFRFASPFPSRLAVFEATPKLVIVSVAVQAFAAYDSGRLVRWGPVSTGAAASPTLPGTFNVTWKLPEHRSTTDSTWVMRWCVNIENRVGTALHQYALPGRPASHCCIRLTEADARWVYDWVDTWRVTKDEDDVLEPGTPVWVLGRYDFDAPPPWRRLPVDPAADQMSLSELEAWTRIPKGESP